jgi:hypothetical protein
MVYPETLYTALASAAAGGAVFCVLCIFSAAVFHRQCRRWRFSAFCVLLSIAVASLALLFIFTPFTLEKLKLRPVVVWNFSFGAAGMLCTAFYKILVPIVSAAYIALALCTYHLMQVRYPVPRKPVPVSVNGSMFFSGVVKGGLVPCPGGASCIILDVCMLPDWLLFPFSREWYSFHVPAAETPDIQGGENIPVSLTAKYMNCISGGTSVVYVPVPSASGAAAMYTLDCRSLPPVLTRVL